MSKWEYSIGPAGPEDLGALERIEVLCFDASVTISPRQFRYLLRSPAAGIFVCRHGGQVAGDAIVVRRRLGGHVFARMYSLAVAPEHRGKGFGRALLMRCVEALRAEGARDLTLEVGVENTSAIALYESLGFHKVRRLGDYYGAGRDAWRMSLCLSTTA